VVAGLHHPPVGLLGFGKRAPRAPHRRRQGRSQRDALKAYDPAVLKVLLYLLQLHHRGLRGLHPGAHALRMFHTRSLI
jgi:hypothetical protein